MVTGRSVVVIQGASRGIGAALVRYFLERCPHKPYVFATCRDPSSISVDSFASSGSDRRLLVSRLDLTDEVSIETSAKLSAEFASNIPDGIGVHALFNVAGILQEKSLGVTAERRLTDVTLQGMQNTFAVNAFGPMLVAKHFAPLLGETAKTLRRKKDDSSGPKMDDKTALMTPSMTFLSARVGSISENESGGWYSYRASKAALNANVKGMAMELKSKGVCAVALHPGTVDTDLTRTFMSARAKYQVQDVNEAAENLAEIAQGFTMADSGTFIDWQRKPIAW